MGRPGTHRMPTGRPFSGRAKRLHLPHLLQVALEQLPPVVGLKAHGAGELQGELLNPPAVGPRHTRRDSVDKSLTPGSPATPEPGLAPLIAASMFSVVSIQLPLAAVASVVEHPPLVGDAPHVPSVLPDHIGPGSDQSKPGLGQDRVQQMLGPDEMVARAKHRIRTYLPAGLSQFPDQRLLKGRPMRRLHNRPKPAHIVRGLGFPPFNLPHSYHLLSLTWTCGEHPGEPGLWGICPW